MLILKLCLLKKKESENYIVVLTGCFEIKGSKKNEVELSNGTCIVHP